MSAIIYWGVIALLCVSTLVLGFLLAVAYARWKYGVCPRVEQRIECPECEYPASESLYMLSSNGNAIEPISKEMIRDPGHRL